jgi:hypothetical protein
MVNLRTLFSHYLVTDLDNTVDYHLNYSKRGEIPMWRTKALAISVVLLGALLFGAVVAYAGWSWNAKADVEGTRVSTSSSVAQGGKAQYQAAITIAVPANASVEVVEFASNETVNVVHTKRRCSGGAIDALVTYVITGSGHGTDVSVSVDGVNNGENYGSASGSVGTPISVSASIAGECSG